MEEKQYDETTEVEEETSQEDTPEEDTSSNETEDGVQEEKDTEEDTSEEVDWKARALKAEKAIVKAKEKQKGSKSESIDPEKLTRIELKAEGIREPEDQNYIMRVARAEGIDPVEALNIDFVQDRLKANERKRLSDAATPRGNNRTGNPKDEVTAAVRKYKKTGELPDDNPGLTAKVLKELKNGA